MSWEYAMGPGIDNIHIMQVGVQSGPFQRSRGEVRENSSICGRIISKWYSYELFCCSGESRNMKIIQNMFLIY
jgi:hypothetical protein